MKLLAALLMSLSISAFAEMNQEEMMKKMQEAGAPGEAHKVLAEMEGEWTFTSKNWEKPNAKPELGSGTSSLKMVMGGRYLQQELKSKMMGMDYEGLGFTGYDNVKKEYNIVWMDSMSTGMMKATASYDSKTKTLTEKGEFSCPMTENKKSDYRADWKMIDKNNALYTMYGKGATGQGKEFKMMELTYKRKQYLKDKN